MSFISQLHNYVLRYRLLKPSIGRGKDKKVLCENLLKELNFPTSQCQKGLTKVFLKSDMVIPRIIVSNKQFNKLEVMREEKLNKSVVTIQKTFRMWVTRRYYTKLRVGAIKAQACITRRFQI